MNNNSKGSNVFKWVFFVLSAGTLVSAGIFIEKIILSDAAWMDYFSVIFFGVVGLGISAYSFFRSSVN